MEDCAGKGQSCVDLQERDHSSMGRARLIQVPLSPGAVEAFLGLVAEYLERISRC